MIKKKKGGGLKEKAQFLVKERSNSVISLQGQVEQIAIIEPKGA